MIIFLRHACSVNDALAFSPSFPSTQITDPLHDAVPSVNVGKYGCGLRDSSLFPDISGITYASDGKNLTATIWFNAPITKYIMDPSSFNNSRRTVATLHTIYPKNTFIDEAQGENAAVERYLQSSTFPFISHQIKTINLNNMSFKLDTYSIEKPYKRYGFMIISNINPHTKQIITYESHSKSRIYEIINAGLKKVSPNNFLFFPDDNVKLDLKNYMSMNQTSILNDTLAKFRPTDYERYKKFHIVSNATFYEGLEDLRNYIFRLQSFLNDTLSNSSPPDYERYKKFHIVSNATHTLSSSPIIRDWIYSEYSMQVGINSVYDTSPDYLQSIVWWHATPHHKKTWNSTISEISPDSTQLIILKTDNISAANIFKNGTRDPFHNGSIDLKFNLSPINFPASYNLLFHTGGKFILNIPHQNIACSIDDLSDLIIAPPPEIQLSTDPNNLVLESGLTKHIKVTVNSSTDLDSRIQLSINNAHSWLKLKFVPSEISLSPHGLATSDLQISGNSTNITSTTLPITAQVTFPAIFKSMASSSLLSTSNLTNVTLRTSPFVTVIPPKSIPAQITDIFTDVSVGLQQLGGVLTTIGIIAASIGGLFTILRRVKKNNERSDSKSGGGDQSTKNNIP
jgi:hypothetical protein